MSRSLPSLEPSVEHAGKIDHPEWILTIGEIVAPFGIKGEIKVRLETDFPDRFAKLKQVCLRKASGVASLYKVRGARKHKEQVLLSLEGIDRIEDVELLRGCLVQIRNYEAVRLPENEFYIHDLIGCKVVTLEGKDLGSVRSILRSPANDVYVLGEGKSEILLPGIKEVIRSVDLEARLITVAPSPGLLPEDEAEAED